MFLKLPKIWPGIRRDHFQSFSVKECEMALIEWNDEFSVQNNELDEQHKELVKMTNDLYTGCQMGGIMAKVYFLKTVQGAVHYVKTHFATEEKIIQEIGYPEFDAHKKQHEDFVAHVTEQVRILDREDNPNPTDFVKFLMDWIVLHIANSDKKYVPYIAAQKQ
jgi:hemerythrin